MRALPLAALLLLPVLQGTLAAQHVISTKAGLINLIQGEVKLNDEAVVVRNSRFAEMKNGDVLRTEEGRAEVMLAPGSVLRLAEKSAFRMESNSIINTRLGLLEGDAILEVMEMPKDSSLEVLIGADKLSIQKAGLYRLNATELTAKVMVGELAVVSNDVLRRVTEGRMMTLTGDHLVAKFDKKSGDELSRWASRRSSQIAMANVSSAKTIFDNGFSFARSGWFFNPWYGCYTFVPFGNSFMSPFGFSYWSPNNVYSVLIPQINYGSLGGSVPNAAVGIGGFGGGPTMGGYDRGSMRGGGYSGGSYGGGPAVGGSMPSGSAGGAERATGSAGAEGARGGGASSGSGSRGNY